MRLRFMEMMIYVISSLSVQLVLYRFILCTFMPCKMLLTQAKPIGRTVYYYSQRRSESIFPLRDTERFRPLCVVLVRDILIHSRIYSPIKPVLSGYKRFETTFFIDDSAVLPDLKFNYSCVECQATNHFGCRLIT